LVRRGWILGALVGEDSQGAVPADVEGDTGEEAFEQLEVPIGVLDGHGGVCRFVGEGGALGEGDSGFPEEIFEGEGLALGDPLFLWHGFKGGEWIVGIDVPRFSRGDAEAVDDGGSNEPFPGLQGWDRAFVDGQEGDAVEVDGVVNTDRFADVIENGGEGDVLEVEFGNSGLGEGGFERKATGILWGGRGFQDSDGEAEDG